MATSTTVVEPVFTESRVYGVTEDAVLAALPGVLAQVARGAEIENPVTGCFTARVRGPSWRELIVRVEPETDGTRVRLDVRRWQDTRYGWLLLIAVLTIFPAIVLLLYFGARSIFSRPDTPLPPEVFAHGIFHGLSAALSTKGGSGYRVAAAKEIVAHADEDEVVENDRRSQKSRG